MSKKIKLWLALMILASFSLLSLKYFYDSREPAYEWKIQSINILPVAGRDAKLGYDTKAVVEINIPKESSAPKLKDHELTDRYIFCKDAHLVLTHENRSKTLQQKPKTVEHFHTLFLNTPTASKDPFTVSMNSLTVSYLYSKKKLPAGNIVLHGAVKVQNWYNVRKPGKSKGKHYDYLMPVNIQIQ